MPGEDLFRPVPGAVVTALERARELGFLGEGDIETQLRHAAGFAAARASSSATPPSAGPASVLDLGSGGGVPGLVLAAIWPACHVTLLDANARRCAFLREAVAECDWQDRVVVVEARAEEAGRAPTLRAALDLVVARSFGQPAVVAECAAPFLHVGGLLIVSEPPPEGSEGAREPTLDDRPASGSGQAGAGSRWPPGPLAQVGLVPLAVHRGEFGYQVLRQETVCPDRFPRRVGVPAKRPLY